MDSGLRRLQLNILPAKRLLLRKLLIRYCNLILRFNEKYVEWGCEEKFQEDDTQVWDNNSTQGKEQLLSRKIHSGARNRLIPVSVEWGGSRRIRAHRVKIPEKDAAFETL
ncbi:hypothetical protein AVEN_5596-1 [Araneus ventricosus]|uniref:Uncharacterized protein n=1 Tax=Araneus ventricosus TaxID=182803 RepID=A0A4Y2K6K8_ARAVE|nr:hypothetical protein AVEN_5596-1 [Araneus ventricosus]